MIGNVFEFLFCPLHGVFRPDNIALIWLSMNGTVQYLMSVIRRRVL
jgi:hypothetical protein